MGKAHHLIERPALNDLVPVDIEAIHESTSLIQCAVSSNTDKWLICGDLKVIELLLGLQIGMKFCCFLCFWNTRTTQSCYQVQEWPLKDQFIPGQATSP